MAKKFDRLLEKATDATLVEADWEMIMNSVDCVRSGEVPPKNALASVRKRYHANNPHVCHHALLVLEALVKNCGDKFHKEVATKECMEDMKHLAAESSEKVKEKILELIQCWAHAFRDKPEYKIVKDTHALMKLEGFTFPAFREADAMFAAEVAPEWVDADTCYRCKTAFSLLNRKHHCRNCGQIFCDKCSSRYIPLPHIGIEKEVRVCETCFDKVLKRASEQAAIASAGNGTKTGEKSQKPISGPPLTDGSQPVSGGKTEETTREEEELQLALAISQSEAEERERQRQRALVHMYNGPGQESNSVVNGNLGYKGVMDGGTSTPADRQTVDQSDNELARYLNRDYWEQRRVEQKTGILRQSPTPSAPSSDTSPVLGTGDNGTAPMSGQGDFAGGNENGVASRVETTKQDAGGDVNLAQFAHNLRTTVDAFINRIRSDQMRGRSILGDGNVQTMFMTLTNMHSQLLKHLNELDDRRGYFESLQDKLVQIQDAREAIEALRDEHEQHRRAELLEQQRQRQHQMFAKLGTMRQKKHEMLEQQRLVALHRVEEERRQMEMRKQMQQQASMMARFTAHGSPAMGAVHQPGQPTSHFPGVQQQQPSQSYYGVPGSGAAMAAPYDMHQMAAALPGVHQQQPPPPASMAQPPASMGQQQVSNYAPQYQNYGQPAQGQFQVNASSQPGTYPQQTMGSVQQSPVHQPAYYQPPYSGQQPLVAPSQAPPSTYYSPSPAVPHSVPQQQPAYPGAGSVSGPGSVGGYGPSGGYAPSMPQYVTTSTTGGGYDGQQQMPQMYQQSQPMQQNQQPQQPIPEAQLISFD